MLRVLRGLLLAGAVASCGPDDLHFSRSPTSSNVAQGGRLALMSRATEPMPITAPNPIASVRLAKPTSSRRGARTTHLGRNNGAF